MSFIGIDIGTFSSVSASAPHSEPHVLSVDVNAVSNRATPTSIVYNDNGGILVGEEAEHRLYSMWNVGNAIYPNFSKNTIDNDETILLYYWYIDRLLSFRSDDISNSTVVITHSNNEHADYILNACLLLKKIKYNTIDFKVVSSSNYPIIASYVHKEITSGKFLDKRVGFLDIGHTHSNAFVTRLIPIENLSEGKSRLSISIEFNEELKDFGVDTFVNSIYNHLINSTHPNLPRENDKRIIRLKQNLLKAIKDLSMFKDTLINFENFDEDNPVDELINFQITRENLISWLPEGVWVKYIKFIEKLQENCDYVELIGGGSRMPILHEAFSNYQTFCHRGLDGSSCLSTGAALLANVEEIKQRFELKNSSEKIESILFKEGAILTENSHFHQIISDKWKIHENLKKKEQIINTFESLIYSSQDALTNDKDGVIENKEEFQKILSRELNWFYEEMDQSNITFEDISEKYSNLTNIVDKYLKSYRENNLKKQKMVEEELNTGEEKRIAQEELEGGKEDHDFRKMKPSDRLDLAKKNKEEGTILFKAQNIKDAILRYQKAIGHLEKIDSSNEEINGEKKTIYITCQLNIAQCYLNQCKSLKSKPDLLEQFSKKCINCCDRAIEKDEHHLKANYRKLLALEYIRDYDEMKKILNNLFKKHGEDGLSDFVKIRERVNNELAKQKAKSKKVFANMFG